MLNRFKVYFPIKIVCSVKLKSNLKIYISKTKVTSFHRTFNSIYIKLLHSSINIYIYIAIMILMIRSNV